MFVLSLSTVDECEIITQMSKDAFSSDVLVGGEPNQGPSNYDSLSWHLIMQKQNRLYSFKADNVVVGAAVLFNCNTVLIVGRIFINPIHYKKGYGQELMSQIEHLFPNAKLIKLETPTWNIRTNQFYKKCGYTEVKRNIEDMFYEKRLK